MNLLIPHGRMADKYLSWAAQEMGHAVHFMCNYQETNKLGETRRDCLPNYWKPVQTRFDLDMNHATYQHWYAEQIRNYVVDNGIDAILPCSSMDAVMREVAWVNEDLNLPGIRPHQARFVADKSVYLQDMKESGILVPDIYEIVEPGSEPTNYDIRYPCIAKPALGCGGFGVFIAYNADQLKWFFGSSDRPSDFSERGAFYQDHDENGKPKSYLHFGMGGRYIIQKYLPGPCVSVSGVTTKSVLDLSCVYDIGVTKPPTCSEMIHSWPCDLLRADSVAELVLSKINRKFRHRELFPDGAFMADFILHEHDLYLIDFSTRMASAGTKVLYHACEDRLSYPRNVVHAVLGEYEKIVEENPTKPTHCEYFPFPKGRLSNVSYPDITESDTAVIEECVTPIQDGSYVYEMRNDVQVLDRGWVNAVGKTRHDARSLVEMYISGIQYDVD